jgi:hypothetical protein
MKSERGIGRAFPSQIRTVSWAALAKGAHATFVASLIEDL